MYYSTFIRPVSFKSVTVKSTANEQFPAPSGP